MDLEDVIKRHEERLRESIPFQTAAEAAAKALTDPAVHSMMQTQSRIAREAIASLIKAPDVQSTLASLAAGTSLAATKQFAEMFNDRSGFAAQMAGLVSEMRQTALSGFVGNLLKEQEQRTQELVRQMTAASRFSGEAFMASTRPHFDYERVPRFVRPVVPERREAPTEEFMRCFKEHLQTAEEEIAESGGKLIVTCKTPGGDELFVQQVSTKDEHFIHVVGIDQFNQHREFTGHHSSIGLAIEVVVADSEDPEADREPVN